MPVQSSATDGGSLARQAFECFTRAEVILRRRLTADLDREGLSYSGYIVLLTLSEVGGELEMRRLRGRLGSSKANVTEVVSTLESHGLVGRYRLAYDRRAAAVRLTLAGRELIDRVAPEHDDRIERIFAALSADEQRQLATICSKLGEAMVAAAAEADAVAEAEEQATRH